MPIFQAGMLSISFRSLKSVLPQRNTGYKIPLLQDKDEKDDVQIERHHTWSRQQGVAILAIHIGLLTLYLVVFALYVFRIERTEPTMVERASLYSPAQVAIGSYSTKVIDGTVSRSDSRWNMSSKWVGEPSVDLDAIWDKLTPPIPRIRLAPEEVSRAGYSVDKGYILEDGDHTAILNVHHQLHCLNAIRKMTYIDYYTALGQHTSHALARDHIDHCIEMLRQSLVCYADISVMPYIHDMEGNIRPDFDTVLQCRDYDRIVEWNWENMDGRPLPASASN